MVGLGTHPSTPGRMMTDRVTLNRQLSSIRVWFIGFVNSQCPPCSSHTWFRVPTDRRLLLGCVQNHFHINLVQKVRKLN